MCSELIALNEVNITCIVSIMLTFQGLIEICHLFLNIIKKDFGNRRKKVYFMTSVTTNCFSLGSF